jgi:hypothetical protein
MERPGEPRRYDLDLFSPEPVEISAVFGKPCGIHISNHHADIIQVKSKNKGLAAQMDRTVSIADKVIIGGGPDLKPSVMKEVQRRGGLVTTDEDQRVVWDT